MNKEMKKFRSLNLKESQELNVNELDSIMAGSGTATWWFCTCSRVGDTCKSASATWGNADEIRFQELLKGSISIASGLIASSSGTTIGIALSAAQTVDGFMDICSAIGISGYTTNHRCIKYPIENVHESHTRING